MQVLEPLELVNSLSLRILTVNQTFPVVFFFDLGSDELIILEVDLQLKLFDSCFHGPDHLKFSLTLLIVVYHLILGGKVCPEVFDVFIELHDLGCGAIWLLSNDFIHAGLSANVLCFLAKEQSLQRLLKVLAKL